MALFEIEAQSPVDGIGNAQVYADLANQLVLISTVMIVMYLIALSSKKKDLMNEEFLMVYLFVLIGVGYYHLLVKRLLLFV